MASEETDSVDRSAPVQTQVQALVEEFKRLDQTVHAQADRIDDLEATVRRQRDRIDELESDVVEARGLAQGAANGARTARQAIAGADTTVLDPDHEDFTPILERLPSDGATLEELQQALRDEQIERSRNDAKLKRQLRTLADRVGEDLNDLPVEAEDKIARLANQGPADVVDTVYKVHERAHDVLANLTEWGQHHDDAHGTYVLLTSPTARENLELLRDESLQPTEVRRVFEKIEALGRDSPRRVSVGKTPDGRTRLKITFEGDR